MTHRIGLHDKLLVKNEPFQIGNYVKPFFILWGEKIITILLGVFQIFS